MVIFPLSLLLIPYAVAMAAIGFFSFLNLRNLARYRSEDAAAFAATFIFFAGFALIAYFSFNLLSPINWKEIVEIKFQTAAF